MLVGDGAIVGVGTSVGGALITGKALASAESDTKSRLSHPFGGGTRTNQRLSRSRPRTLTRVPLLSLVTAG